MITLSQSLSSLLAGCALLACTTALAVDTASSARLQLVTPTYGPPQWTYTVQRGQTLYSLSRELGVSQDVIIENNPSVGTDGLKAGQVLRLPYAAVQQPESVQQTQNPIPAAPMPAADATHLVRKGETVYGISRQYGMTPDQLIALNPWAQDGIRSGQVLRVSAAAAQSPGAQAPRPSEDADQQPEPFQVEPVPVVLAEETVETQEGEQEAQPSPVPVKDSYTIAVMLPLMLQDGDAAAQSRLAQTYTAFVRGMALAADTLGAPGMGAPVTISVIDTEASPARVARMALTSQVTDADVVIAPEDAASLSALKDAGVLVFNIFNVQDDSWRTTPSLIQANIPHDLMYDKAIGALLDGPLKAYTPVILRPEGSKEDKAKFVNRLTQRYHAAGRPVRQVSFSGNLTVDALVDSLGTDGAESFVFIPVSAAWTDVNRAYNAITAFRGRLPYQDGAVVFGYPEWSVFRGERLDKLHRMHATIYSRFYDEPGNAHAEDVAQAYRRWYGEEIPDQVPKQEILGYDVATFLIQALRRGGAQPLHDPLPWEGAQSAFRLSRQEGSAGMANEALYLITFHPGELITRTIL